MRPLLNALGLLVHEDQSYATNKARQLTLAAARNELDHLNRMHAVSPAVYESLAKDIEHKATTLAASINDIQQATPQLLDEEIRQAKLRLLSAERAALQRGVIEGLVSNEVNEILLAESAEDLDRLSRNQH